MRKNQRQHAFELTDHFFRHEYSKMVAVISRYFKAETLDLAEDIVQETLLEAVKKWEVSGIPTNPKAWLYTVARNKTINTLKKGQTDRKAKSEITRLLKPDPQVAVQELFSESQISDNLLEMMFVCCHPRLSDESQIVLILKTLCGFSISEISRAFLTNNETINKRLVRARKALKKHNIKFEIPGKDLTPRLTAVLKTIYLLFNEGYNATAGNKLIRYDLCAEAIRLLKLILSHPIFKDNTHVHALLALTYLNSARFEARIDDEGNMLEMSRQDRKKWNETLINRGLFHLDQIRNDREVSEYHILAAISAYHCTAPSYKETDWASILFLYDQLLNYSGSPVIRLNRAIAMAKVHGNKKAILELTHLQSGRMLNNYAPFYSVLGSLLMEEGLFEEAAFNLKRALQLTKVGPEIKTLKAKLATCEKNNRARLSLF